MAAGEAGATHEPLNIKRLRPPIGGDSPSPAGGIPGAQVTAVLGSAVVAIEAQAESLAQIHVKAECHAAIAEIGAAVVDRGSLVPMNRINVAVCDSALLVGDTPSGLNAVASTGR